MALTVRNTIWRGHAVGAPVAMAWALLGLVAACGSDDQPTAWVRNGQVADPSTIESYRGAEHCGWQDVTFLTVRWPVDGTGATTRRMYVRDPDDVLASHTRRGFSAHATLPPSAESTGFSSELGALWLVTDGEESSAYIVSGDDVEEWPATDQILGCD